MRSPHSQSKAARYFHRPRTFPAALALARRLRAGARRSSAVAGRPAAAVHAAVGGAADAAFQHNGALQEHL